MVFILNKKILYICMSEKMYCLRPTCGWVGTRDDLLNDNDDIYCVFEYHRFCPWCDRDSCVTENEMRKLKLRNILGGEECN